MKKAIILLKNHSVHYLFQ